MCDSMVSFYNGISNPHTHRAYARPVGRFLTWCQAQGIELCQVTPGLAGRFIEDLPGSDPTRNLALAALRHRALLIDLHALVRGEQRGAPGYQDQAQR